MKGLQHWLQKRNRSNLSHLFNILTFSELKTKKNETETIYFISNKTKHGHLHHEDSKTIEQWYHWGPPQLV